MGRGWARNGREDSCGTVPGAHHGASCRRDQVMTAARTARLLLPDRPHREQELHIPIAIRLPGQIDTGQGLKLPVGDPQRLDQLAATRELADARPGSWEGANMQRVLEGHGIGEAAADD